METKRNKRACKPFRDSRAFLHWSDQTTFYIFFFLFAFISVYFGVKLWAKIEKMSGAGKKIADVAFKASRTIDWDGMTKVLVTDEARREFSNLRRAFDEVNTQLQTKFSQVSLSIYPLLSLLGLDLHHFDLTLVFWIRWFIHESLRLSDFCWWHSFSYFVDVVVIPIVDPDIYILLRSISFKTC